MKLISIANVLIKQRILWHVLLHVTAKNNVKCSGKENSQCTAKDWKNVFLLDFRLKTDLLLVLQTVHHLLPPLLLGRWGFCSCLHLLHLVSFSIHSPKQISNQAKTKHPFINKLNVPQTKVLQAPILSLPKLSKHHFSKHRQAPNLLSSTATSQRWGRIIMLFFSYCPERLVCDRHQGEVGSWRPAGPASWWPMIHHLSVEQKFLNHALHTVTISPFTRIFYISDLFWLPQKSRHRKDSVSWWWLLTTECPRTLSSTTRLCLYKENQRKCQLIGYICHL